MSLSQSINIRIELLKLGIKLKDIAIMLNVKPHTVSEVLSGKKKSKRIISTVNRIIKEHYEQLAS